MPPETDSEKIARLERENVSLKEEIERLRRLLEEALRAAKRQAAPFSRRAPKAHPEKPGRRSGSCYGRIGQRAVPQHVDQTLEAELPLGCPHCGGALTQTAVVEQYQAEIAEPQVQHLRFRIHVGHCRRCGRRMQGRHPRQTSDALGSAGSQLGPRAVALATRLNKGLGLPYGKTASVLQQAFALQVTRGGLCQAIARAARKAEPTYDRLAEQIRTCRSVTPDETGWKVGGHLWWLWAFAAPGCTVYAIQPGRGFVQAAAVLGTGFDGFLVRDGWSVYRQFADAMHQSCLAHLLRRCREMSTVSRPAAARFPQRVQAILQQALRLRDRRLAGQLSPHGVTVACGRLEAQIDRALAIRYRAPANQRLANHLYRERDALFTFLHCPGLEATNWRAEQALRPMVVARKVWGGNRTPRGARTQQILLSVLETCRQQQRSVSDLLITMLCAPKPSAIKLALPDRSPP